MRRKKVGRENAVVEPVNRLAVGLAVGVVHGGKRSLAHSCSACDCDHRCVLLGAAVAIGGLDVSGRIARGQITPRIEKLAPELDKVISASEPIRHLADGFGGQLGPAEGPVWWKEGRYLLFSDIHNNRR